jgi:hypothetical protein
MRNQLIREKVDMQFRAEAFNVFNTPQWNAPDSNVNSSTFERILETATIASSSSR